MSRVCALPIFVLLVVNYTIRVHVERRLVCALGVSLTNLYLQQIKLKDKAAIIARQSAAFQSVRQSGDDYGPFQITHYNVTVTYVALASNVRENSPIKRNATH